MSFAHEAIAALPTLTAADKSVLRSLVEQRFIFALTSAETATDFVAVDPDTGVLPLYLIQNNILFQYDSSDTTTTHDGVTCLVSNEGKRYKSDTITYPWSVLDKDTTAQPGSPSVGDRYIVPTSATGTNWAGQDGKIGVYTAAGWFFVTVPIGRFVYVEDETAFYHRNAAGTWTAGVGSITLGDSSVPITAIIGANASLNIKVENQTTNTPPGSPVSPVAYIIGSSPTGDWAGNAGKLAICLVDGSFEIITPAAGDIVFDKALNAHYQYKSSAWISAVGAWAFFTSSFTEGTGSQTQAGSIDYSYSSSSAPSISANRTTSDDVTITRTASRVGAIQRFRYTASLASIGNLQGVGLFIDSNTSATAWIQHGNITQISAEFIYTAVDVLSHTFKIALIEASGHTTAISRRLFTLEESP